MIRIPIIFLAAFLYFAVSVTAYAEGPEPPAYRLTAPGKRILLLGVFGGGGLVMHGGPFATREGRYECCTYPDGSGIGFGGGAKAVIPLQRRLFLIPRAGFETFGGEFDSEPFSYPILGAGNSMEMADFENSLEATVSAVTIGVHAAYVFTDFGLYVSAGPSLSYILSRDYTSTDVLTGPPGVRFQAGGTERTVHSGDMDITQSTFFSIEAALGALLEVTPSVYLNPELMYGLPITPVSKEGDWTIGRALGSVGILLVF